MASIRKLPSGRWQAQVRRQGHYAQRTFTTKPQAERWARRVEMEIEDGTYGCEQDITPLRDLLEKYLREVTPRKKGADRERRRILQLQGDPIADLPASGVAPEQIAAYRDKRMAVVSGETVRKELALLSSVFQVAAAEWGHNFENPVTRVRRPPPSKPRDRRLGWRELRLLLTVADQQKNPQVGAIVRLAILTAMRLSEVLGLRWEYIDLNEQYLVIPDTKNGDARAVPLSLRAVRVLERLGPEPEGRVFSYTVDGFRTIWHRMTRSAGLADLRFHDLRHEATSRFFEQGLGVMEAAAITGHRSLQMLKRYTHLRVQDLARRIR